MKNIVAQLTYEQLVGAINEAVVQNDSYLALRMSRDIDNLDKNHNANLFNQIQSDQFKRNITRLKFVCLPSLKEKEIINLFESNILDIIDDEYIDIVNKIKTYLLAIPDFAARDVFRRKLREALMRNIQIIGSNEINTEEGPLKPEVRFWLKIYNTVTGPEASGGFGLSQFLSGNQNVQKLKESELKKLRSLLWLFEFLKVSSQTPQGLEDPVIFNFNGQLKVLKNGNFEDIKLPTNDEKTLKEILEAYQSGSAGKKISDSKEESQLESDKQPLPVKDSTSSVDNDQEAIIKAYQGDPAWQQSIDKEEEKLKSKLSDKIENIHQEFFVAVQRQQKPKVVACLKLLAEKNDLITFLHQDKKLNVFMKAVWQKRYGSDFIKDFDANPDQPRFIKLFLRYVLEERLGMTENEAARVGLQIGNILSDLGNQDFTQIAFFDLPNKQFQWFEE